MTLFGVASAYLWDRVHRTKGQLPIYGEVPDFSLTERSGMAFSREKLKGQIWIADFIFTRCGGQCLLMSEKMKEIQNILPQNIKYVSISVDPRWDTPEVLTQYAQKYEAKKDQWFFLTGDREKIFSLAGEGFHLGVEEGGTSVEPIMHSNRFVLVDGQSRIRGIYSAIDSEALERLEKEAKALLSENK